MAKKESDGKTQSKVKKEQSQEKRTESSVEPQVTRKQVMVGIVILCVALILFMVSLPDICHWFGNRYKPFQPKNVIAVFETRALKAVDYDIYYTLRPETWFGEDKVIHVKGEAGTHTYVVHIPTEKIYRFRLDFSENPGDMEVHMIRLMGTQSEDLSNFKNYQYNQLDDPFVTKKKGFYFRSKGNDPFMIYNDEF